jgi:hypothetical protein
MVATTLTNELIEDGKSILEKIDKTAMKVDAALWFYLQDGEKWRLMLSVEGVEKEGPRKIYGQVQKLMAKEPKARDLSLDKITLLKPNAPLLQLMKTAIKTGPGISGIRYTGNAIKGQFIPDAYIYRLVKTS